MPSPLRFAPRARVLTSRPLALDRASGRRIDEDGHLHVSSNVISAAQVNGYLGSEIDADGKLGLQPDRVYRIFRDPAELAKGAASFANKPLLVLHRSQTANDYDRDLVVGSISNPKWVSPNLMAELVIWDSAAIKAVQNGSQSALSCGYWFDLDMTAGSYQGQPYDGRFTNIRGNHAALVPEPRVKGAAVGDSAIKQRKVKMAQDDNDDDSRSKLLEFLAEKLSGADLLSAIKIIDGVDEAEEAADPDDADARLQAADRRRQAADARLRAVASDTERRRKMFPHAERIR